MAFRAALNGKVMIGKFTGFTTASVTIPIPGDLVGRFTAEDSAIMVSVQDPNGTRTWGYRIDSFTRSEVQMTFDAALEAADILHVMIAG